MRSSSIATFSFLICAACASTTSDSTSAAPSNPPGALVPADAPCVTGPGNIMLIPGIGRGVFVDDDFVYTASLDAVVRAPRAGGAVSTVAKIDEASLVAADATSFYLFGSHPVGAPTPDGKQGSGLALYALSRSGDAPRLLLDSAFGNIGASDGTTLSWDVPGGVSQIPVAGGAATISKLENTATVTGMALGRDALFLAVFSIGLSGAPGSGTIRSIPRSGGPVMTLIGGLAHPYGIALDDSRLYFLDPEGGRAVASANLDGSDVKTLATTMSATSIAVDAHAVYFTTAASVTKIDKSTGATVAVATGLESPANVTLHGGNVYWENATTVALSAVNPPYGIMTACK